MISKKTLTIDLFCSVIDNYGDIGVCYRLAKELARNKVEISLYVDDLPTFKKICPQILPTQNIQYLNDDNILVKKWVTDDYSYEPSNVVIEAFACNISPSFTDKFTNSTIWINLEYLSAEKWVESCHKLPSLQNNGVKKFFFFPGFTPNTGGINFENNFCKISSKLAKDFVINKFELSPDIKDFFMCLIFTYENENLFPLIENIIKYKKKVIFLIPDSRSAVYLKTSPLLQKFKLIYSNIIFHFFPMISQDEFNYIIKASDFNIVRGEDSICQAIMSGKPFIWHIYKQKENAHIDKIKAFLEEYCLDLSSPIANVFKNAFITFNTITNNYNLEYSSFSDFMIKYEEICSYSEKKTAKLFNNRNLCSNLLRFIEEKNKDFL